MDTPTVTELVTLLDAARHAAQDDAARWHRIARQLLYTRHSRCRLCGGPPEAHLAACLYLQASEA